MLSCTPVCGVVIKDTANGARGLGFNSRLAESDRTQRRQRLATAATFRRAVLSRRSPAEVTPTLVTHLGLIPQV